MPRDSSLTRQRLLDAALAEFAERGLAGARVDRIGVAAGVNKAQIYHHFGSKDGLFEAVFDAVVERTLTETPIDPSDLPEYAAKLFDSYVAHPDVRRLATWHTLEGGRQVPAITRSYEHKLQTLANAQRDGILPTRFGPEVLLTQILAISSMWATVVPELDKLLDDLTVRTRRQAVVDSVAALLA
jgi:AcrR family transcriptional regulator